MRPYFVLPVLVTAMALGGCSSSSEPAPTVSASPIVASVPAEPSAAASSVADGSAVDTAMIELCNQMMTEKLSLDDATALAEANGYVARVGSIDGELQAVTMDLRPDRFTFALDNGVVTACTFG